MDSGFDSIIWFETNVLIRLILLVNGRVLAIVESSGNWTKTSLEHWHRRPFEGVYRLGINRGYIGTRELVIWEKHRFLQGLVSTSAIDSGGAWLH